MFHPINHSFKPQTHAYCWKVAQGMFRSRLRVDDVSRTTLILAIGGLPTYTFNEALFPADYVELLSLCRDYKPESCY